MSKEQYRKLKEKERNANKGKNLGKVSGLDEMELSPDDTGGISDNILVLKSGWDHDFQEPIVRRLATEWREESFPRRSQVCEER